LKMQLQLKRLGGKLVHFNGIIKESFIKYA